MKQYTKIILFAATIFLISIFAAALIFYRPLRNENTNIQSDFLKNNFEHVASDSLILIPLKDEK